VVVAMHCFLMPRHAVVFGQILLRIHTNCHFPPSEHSDIAI